MTDPMDERLAWMRAAPGRRIEQVIEPVPTGYSVTTRWIEHGTLHRQDCHISLDAFAAGGAAADMKGS